MTLNRDGRLYLVYVLVQNVSQIFLNRINRNVFKNIEIVFFQIIREKITLCKRWLIISFHFNPKK